MEIWSVAAFGRSSSSVALGKTGHRRPRPCSEMRANGAHGVINMTGWDWMTCHEFPEVSRMFFEGGRVFHILMAEVFAYSACRKFFWKKQEAKSINQLDSIYWATFARWSTNVEHVPRSPGENIPNSQICILVLHVDLVGLCVPNPDDKGP